jgi:hypothetical protein
VAGRGREPSHRERWVAAKFSSTAGELGISRTSLPCHMFRPQLSPDKPSYVRRSTIWHSQIRAKSFKGRAGQLFEGF